MTAQYSAPLAAHRLLIWRHAKSSWNNAHLADHDRPLAPRGRRAADVMADHLAGIDPPPALVLCSTALRARDTLEPLRSRLPAGTDVRIEDDLYGASAAELLARLRQVDESTGSVLLVGHNPGLEDLAARLAGGGDPALVARLRAKFPTGALATVSFSGRWKELGSKPARLEAYVVPADLSPVGE
jgi:phosphohistidine phosphatase